MVEEQVLLGDGVTLELSFRSPTAFRLACLKDGRVLVEHLPDGQGKSVEQRRYAFERDVEDALRQG